MKLKNITKESYHESETIIDIELKIKNISDFVVKFHRVPLSLYEVDSNSYNPKLLKLGEFQIHDFNSNMENYKIMIAKRLNISIDINPKKIIDMYGVHTKYDLSNNSAIEYVKYKTTIDATFVSWFILSSYSKDLYREEFKYIYSNSDTITLDLLKLENQIPLRYIFEIMKLIMKNEKKVNISIRNFFEPIIFIDKTRKINIDSFTLLECFYQSCVESSSSTGYKRSDKIPNASYLKKAGIKFECCVEGGYNSISFDVKRRTLILPKITMYHDRTEVILKNLISYEINSGNKYTVRQYTLFMDYLIDTIEDLNILIDNEIITNKMGSDEKAVEMWNNINIGLTTELTSDMREKIQNINKCCKNKYYKLLKEFDEKFLSRPWLVLSVITAFIITSATILQTVYSVISYYPH